MGENRAGIMGEYRNFEVAIMTWEQIRTAHPSRWVVVEALDGRTEGNRRIITDLALIEAFEDDWQPAWARYKAMHKAYPEREFYPLHTDRLALDIGVLDAFGRTTT
jgi:hypothetical protein